MREILIIGNFGAKNLGDELILASALAQNKNVVVMTSDSKYSQKFIGREFETTEFFPSGVRSFWRFCFDARFRQSITSLKKENFEKIIFPGGGLFAIKNRAVWIWTIVFLWAKYFIKKPVHFQSVGVDASMNFFSQILIRFVFHRASSISARDDKSARFLSKICARRIENIGDAAENFVASKFLELKISEEKKEKILCLNTLSPFDFTQILNDKKFENHKKLFVAFEPSDLKFAPEEVEKVSPKTMEEIFNLFSSVEIAIGERLHFLIVAEIFCGDDNVYTPQKPYSEKVRNFCAEKGISIFNK